MTVRSLRVGEEEACLDLWEIGFPETTRGYFERYFADPGWTHEDTVVAAVGEQLVSVVHVVRRRVSSPVGELGLAGIANVTTHPDARRRGYNTACLTELLARVEADPTLDLCLLGTGIHAYYARFGFARWDFAGREGTPVGAVRNPDDGLLVCPATPDDRRALERLYSEYNLGRPFAVLRPTDYWRDWMRLDDAQVLVATGAEGTPAGYVLHRIEDDCLLVEELAAVGDERRALEALLVEAIRLARPQGVTRLRLLVPLDDAVQDVADTLLVDAAPFPIDWWMVRPLKGHTVPLGFWNRRPFYWESDSF